ncbi:DinB family protein [Xanthocytophaga agilis]|uniref:DinB family protein n=1 Tax=Xanthocytophaga agilis TaxID=3048010 RepID=A0AAE3RE62_9BACT|nr:DinB family protein [Xanthocytophaga agilis]MDJ1506213.1 DinB family protein [Xanthocytophaga agilis]
MKPQPNEYPQSEYTSRYINLVPEDNAIDILRQKEVWQLVHTLSEEESTYRYAEGKWSIKEMLGHMIDTERIFTYRVLCIARGEKQPLPGFDENLYAETAHFDSRTLVSLLAEYSAVRDANLFLFDNLDETALLQIGNANGKELSVRAILYMIAGHERHHINILKERYLKIQ